MRILQSYKAKLPYGRNTKALQFVKYKSSALYVRGHTGDIRKPYILPYKAVQCTAGVKTKAIRCMTEKYLVEKYVGFD